MNLSTGQIALAAFAFASLVAVILVVRRRPSEWTWRDFAGGMGTLLLRTMLSVMAQDISPLAEEWEPEEREPKTRRVPNWVVYALMFAIALAFALFLIALIAYFTQ